MVKAGKVRYRHFKLLCVAACKGECPCGKGRVFPKFVSVQGHYNLIFREEEREMTPFCYEDNIALTPYSALASGRLSRKPGEVSKRLRKDSYAKLKYDATKKQDEIIICRVQEIAENRDVTMTEVALA